MKTHGRMDNKLPFLIKNNKKDEKRMATKKVKGLFKS